jgi:hypothetical protein
MPKLAIFVPIFAAHRIYPTICKVSVTMHSIPRTLVSSASALLLLLFSPSAQAIVDTYSTGPGQTPGDNLDDLWQAVYGGWGLLPDGDEDFDGCSNLVECIAGSDPRKADDCLKVGNMIIGGANIIMNFEAKKGKEYQLWQSSNPGGPPPGESGSQWSQVAGISKVATADGPDNLVFPKPPATVYRFYRIESKDHDADNDGVSDWAEAKLGTDVAPNASGGAASDIETLKSLLSLTASAGVGEAYEKEGTHATIQLRRTYGTMPLTVDLSGLPGTSNVTKSNASAGDYIFKNLAGSPTHSVTLPANEGTTAPYTVALVAASPDSVEEVPEMLKVSIALPGAPAGIAVPSATISLKDADPNNAANRKLYVAFLGREEGINSTASGYATALLNGDNTSASISVVFNNLSSEQNTAYIRYGPDQDLAPALPNGQVSGFNYNVAYKPGFMSSDQGFLDALVGGSLGCAISSANFSNKEIFGYFNKASGSTTFDPNNDDLKAPVIGAGWQPPTGDALEREIWRFMNQATMGGTTALYTEIRAECDAAIAGGGTYIDGLSAWMDRQMNPALTPSINYQQLVMAADMEEFALRGNKPINYNNDPLQNGGTVGVTYVNGMPVANAGSPNTNDPGGNYPQNSPNRRREWWTIVLQSQDQLRQRMAQALSEICVISERDAGVLLWHYGAANWWDMLAQGAFGKYRDLLEKVSLNPMMGIYLTSIANRATYDAGGGIIISPDENYAREIMQLFSIGLVLRHPDGSLILSEEGLPIATYDNNDISELARVFTGFSHGARHGTVRAGINVGYGGVTITDQRISPTIYPNGSGNNIWFGRQDGHWYWQAPWTTPMVAIGRLTAPVITSTTTFHDFNAKTLFAGKHGELPLPLTNISALSDAVTHTKAMEEVIKAHDMLAGRSSDSTYPAYNEVSPSRPGHTNTPINISRWLIQRLVTSNPSAGYIYRVQKAYRDSNGNLGAVAKAILLDYEARSLQLADTAISHGKIKEPMIHFAHILRQFKAYSGAPVSVLTTMETGFSETDAPMSKYPATELAKFGTYNLSPPAKPAAWPDGPFRFRIESLRTSLGQSPLDAPSVFNWFYPDFTVPGKLAQAGLFAPEMQTATEAAEVSKINHLYNYTWMALGPMSSTPGVSGADFIFRNGSATPAVRFSTNGGSTLLGWPATILLNDTNWNTGINLTMVGVNNQHISQMAYSGVRYAVTATAPGYGGIAVAPTPVTFIENEPKNEMLVITESGSSTWVTEGGATDTINIRLSAPLPPGASVDVSFAGANGQFTVSPATLTFTATNWSTDQIATVTAVNDPDVENAGAGNDWIVISTTSTTSANYHGIATPNVPVNVNDNDGGIGVIIAESSGFTDVAETNNTAVGQTGVDSYTISLTSAPTANVIVTITPTQFAVNSSGVTFTTGATSRTFTTTNWNVPQTVLVRGNNDTNAEGLHWGRILHTVNTSGGYTASLPVQPIAAPVADDDDYIVLRQTGNETRVMEGGEITDTITVRLRSNPPVPVSVTLSSPQLIFNPATIVFEPTGGSGILWSSDQTVTVTASDDFINEGIQRGSISDSAPLPATATSVIASNAVSAVTITNPGYGYVGIPSVSFVGPSATTTATATATLGTGGAVGTVISTAIPNAGSGYTNTPTVTFSAPASGVTATGTVNMVGDGRVQSITITNPGSGYTAAPTVTIGAPAARVITTAAGYALMTPDGKLSSVVVTNPGSGYTAPPSVTIGAPVIAPVVISALSQSTQTTGTPATNNIAAIPLNVTVLDNDDSRVVINESGGSTRVNEDGTTDTYTIALGRRPDVGSTSTVTLVPSTTGIQVSPVGPFVFNDTNWNTPVTVTVTTTNDATAEPSTTATITHNITSTDPTYDRVNSPVVVVNVDDNDPALAVTQTNIYTQVREGLATVGTGILPGITDTFTVGMNGRNPSATVTVTLVPNGQVTVSPATLTFSSTATAAQTVTVTAVDDAVAEPGLASGVIGFNVASTDSYFNGSFVPPVLVQVTDNDFPGVSIVESGGTTATTEGNGTTDSFTIVLTQAPTANVVLGFNGGSQSRLSTTSTVGAATTASLTFTPANWNTAQTLWTLPFDDTTAELRHLAPLNVSVNAISAPEYAALTLPSITNIITDNDNNAAANVVRITESSGFTSVTESTTTDTFTVVLSQQPTSNVTVTFTGDSQVAVSPSTLTFVPGATGTGTFNVAQTVTVRAIDDYVIEPAILHWGQVAASVASADTFFDAKTITPVNTTVYDNDGPRVNVIQSGGSTLTNENGVTDTYTLSLSHQPAADVVVTITPDAQVSTNLASVTFTTADWAPKTITITAVNDATVEAVTHNGLITHSVASADPLYQNASVATLTVPIWDNDAASIDITPIGGTDTVVTEGGMNDSILIKLNTQPPAGTNVTITLYPPMVFIPPPQIGKSSGYFVNDQGGSNQRDNIVIDYTESILKYRSVFYSTLAALYAPAAIPTPFPTTPSAADNIKLQKAHWAASKAVVDQMDLWFNGGSMKARFPVLVEPHAVVPSPLPPVNARQAIIEAIYAHSGGTNLPATTRYTAEGTYNAKVPPTDTFNTDIRDRVRWCGYLMTVGAPGLISH